LLLGALIGSALTLAVLAVVIPARLFGVSGKALEYSMFRHVDSADCHRLGPSRWRCDVFDGQESLTYNYTVVVSPSGCWKARAAGSRRERGCIGFRDYVRLLDR